jgi:hypothetical protein
MLPNEVVVAINNKYILVVDPNSKEFLEEFPYNKVVTWGASDKAFSVVYGDLVHNRKVFFKTNQVIEKKTLDTHTHTLNIVFSYYTTHTHTITIIIIVHIYILYIRKI